MAILQLGRVWLTEQVWGLQVWGELTCWCRAEVRGRRGVVVEGDLDRGLDAALQVLVEDIFDPAAAPTHRLQPNRQVRPLQVAITDGDVPHP